MVAAGGLLPVEPVTGAVVDAVSERWLRAATSRRRPDEQDRLGTVEGVGGANVRVDLRHIDTLSLP